MNNCVKKEQAHPQIQLKQIAKAKKKYELQ